MTVPRWISCQSERCAKPMHIQSKTHASGKQVNNRRNISPNVPASKKQQGSERAACRQAGRRQRQRFGNQPHPDRAGVKPHYPAGDLGLDWTQPSRGGAQADTTHGSWEFPDAAAGGSATRAPSARTRSRSGCPSKSRGTFRRRGHAAEAEAEGHVGLVAAPHAKRGSASRHRRSASTPIGRALAQHPVAICLFRRPRASRFHVRRAVRPIQ